MNEELNNEILLHVAEAMLKAGLRAVREELAAIGGQPRQRREMSRKSNTKIVADLLREAGHPLHVDEIIRRAAEAGIELHRESIVSAMTKKLLEGKLFRRTGRNEFALLETAGEEAKEVK
ncbi:MAG: hypothetical protein J5692_04555 [Bacteroidales bacterium]|nr:hypothetical protein [Bacteroidales bacterium]